MPYDVLLTFDDMDVSQIRNAVPVLEKYGFRATFYVMQFPEHRSEKNLHSMDVSEVSGLVRRGWEVGNHTAYHINFAFGTTEQITTQVELEERHFARYGLPAPVTFAYPGGPGTEQGMAYIRSRGYVGARANIRRVWHPEQDDPFQIPAFAIADKYPGCFGTIWNEFEADPAERKALVLIYHGIPGPYPEIATQPDDFARQMAFLHEKGCRTWTMADFLKARS